MCRVTVDGQTLLQHMAPSVSMGSAMVPLPPGAFLQAVFAAEVAMAKMVADALAPCRRVADLFCGLGAFSFPIAQTTRVDGFDVDRAQIEALMAARDGTIGLKPVRAEVRNLFTEPLSAKELADYDGVVIDPPRAGASAQVATLAQSDVARVAMVSCNPKTFARDASLLLRGGFELGIIHPFDQFRYSAHLELVATFTRE